MKDVQNRLAGLDEWTGRTDGKLQKLSERVNDTYTVVSERMDSLEGKLNLLLSHFGIPLD